MAHHFSRFLEIAFSEVSGLCCKGLRYFNRNQPPPHQSDAALQPVWTRLSLSACSRSYNETLTQNTQCNAV